VNLPVQHLSDEAVAAFADGMLATPAHNRAARHIALCAECAGAIDEQRAAVSALQAAPAPALPAGLLERLRAVPVTTALRPRELALAPDGSEVFPAFGTSTALLPARPSAPLNPRVGHHEFHLPVAVPHVGRRTQQLALVAVAAAMITVGVAASASADTAGPGQSRLAPAGGNPVQQLGYSTRRNNVLVTTLAGHHN
jgi:hypothetical protein